MKRRGVILICFIFILILFLSFVRGFTLLDCIDSDNSPDYTQGSLSGIVIGGNDKYIKGTVKGAVDWGAVITNFSINDSCVKINTNALVTSCQNTATTQCGVDEYFCYATGWGSRYIECLNGCNDGVCLKEPVESPPKEETCVDSDGGKNYFVKGSATSFDGYGNPVAQTDDKCYLRRQTGGGINVDSCSGEYCAVEEAVCVNSDTMIYSPNGEGTICPNGCRDGACCLDYNCGGLVNITNEINITILENGEYSVSPETIHLRAGQKIIFKIISMGVKLDSQFNFIPKYIYNTSWGSIGMDEQVKRINLCNGTVCSGEIELEFVVPDIWVGEYYLELRTDDLKERFYYKFEVQNDLYKIDSGSCISVVKNGEPDNKLDIVFIADNYNESTLADFSSKVNDFIYNGLLVPEPLKSRSNEINFYRIDRIGSLRPPKARVYPGPEFWINMVSQCPAHDIVIVVQKNRESTPVAFSGDIPPWILVDASQRPEVVVHEFGHAFANLGDEYQGVRNMVGEEDELFDRPNIDKPGCPKWCSGSLNQTAVLVIGDDSPFNCYNAYSKFLDCVKLNEIEYCWENVSQIGPPDLETGRGLWFAGIEECNLGVSCRGNSGCYWNAKAVNTFRPSSNSIMRGCSSFSETPAPGLEESCQFNLMSQEAISERLDTFSSVNFIQEIIEWFKNILGRIF